MPERLQPVKSRSDKSNTWKPEFCRHWLKRSTPCWGSKINWNNCSFSGSWLSGCGVAVSGAWLFTGGVITVQKILYSNGSILIIVSSSVT